MTIFHPAATAMLSLLAVMTLDQRPASDEVYRPWCIGYVATISNSCTFTSFEQCMMTARGSGGSCMQNPWYLQYGERGPATPARYKGEREKRR